MTLKEKLTLFTEQSKAAAQLILKTAAPGDDGLSVQWARLVLDPECERLEKDWRLTA